MLTYSMNMSLDGYTADRHGRFDWSVPGDDQFRVHLDQVRALGAHLVGRRIYETMLVWETDPSMRDDELQAAFADAWSALPKIVFSRTLDRVEGNARLAQGSLAEEIAAALASTDAEVAIGGPDLAGQAFALGLVDELHMFRHPIVVGGGTPYLAPERSVSVQLLDTTTFASGVVHEHYRVLRESA